MVTVVKLGPRREEQTRYSGTFQSRTATAAVVSASWTRSDYDLGYTRFETGDHFVEYYYTDRWFNIFAIASATGQRKGWYCNIAEPATIDDEYITQVDLLLDLWIDPQGGLLVLDQEEFERDPLLSAEQRSGALQGLEDLLQLVRVRQGPFATIGRQEG